MEPKEKSKKEKKGGSLFEFALGIVKKDKTKKKGKTSSVVKKGGPSVLAVAVESHKDEDQGPKLVHTTATRAAPKGRAPPSRRPQSKAPSTANGQSSPARAPARQVSSSPKRAVPQTVKPVSSEESTTPEPNAVATIPEQPTPRSSSPRPARPSRTSIEVSKSAENSPVAKRKSSWKTADQPRARKESNVRLTVRMPSIQDLLVETEPSDGSTFDSESTEPKSEVLSPSRPPPARPPPPPPPGSSTPPPGRPPLPGTPPSFKSEIVDVEVVEENVEESEDLEYDQENDQNEENEEDEEDEDEDEVNDGSNEENTEENEAENKEAETNVETRKGSTDTSDNKVVKVDDVKLPTKDATLTKDAPEESIQKTDAPHSSV